MVIVLTRLDPRYVKKSDRTLRPPGALPEEDFLATCIRCGACLRICVTHTLQSAGMEKGLIQWGTPLHNMRVADANAVQSLWKDMSHRRHSRPAADRTATRQDRDRGDHPGNVRGVGE